MGEDIYKELFTTSFDSIVVFSPEGIIDFNPAACRLFKCTDEEDVLGLSPFGFIPGYDLAYVSERWPEVIDLINKQGIYLFEGSLKKINGEEFFAEVYISRLNMKDKDWYQAVIRESHDWKSTEKNLEESEEKFRKAFYLNPDSININRMADGMYVSINKGFTEIMGYTEEEIIGKTSREFNIWYNSEDRDKLVAGLKEDGHVTNLEATFRTKNGQLKIGWMSAAIIILKGIPHILSITRDITERKIFEEELLKAKQLAEKSDKLKNAFIANISHEIRTPLHGILGMTSLIEESLSRFSNEEERQLFDSVRRSSKRIMNTIDMILNYSRLHVNDFIVRITSVRLNTVIEHLVDEFKSTAEARKLYIFFENRNGEITINTDEYCIVQSISNIIDNAIKYTNKGYVKVILGKKNEKEVFITIEDTGIGISDEYKELLFQPYTQEESGYSRSYEGIGLGLSLVKKYLELINATISVESRKGEGSKFTIYLTE